MAEQPTAPEMIGRNVARLRSTRRWSRVEAARRLSLLLAEQGQKPWSRQAMYVAEHGQRAWTAIEIAAVAELFEVPPGSLFEAFACPTCRNAPPQGFACTECGASGTRPPAGGKS